MRLRLAVIIVIAAIIGCKPSVPSEYIQPGDLEDILYDYHVAQAIATESRSSGEMDFKKHAYFHAVLKKHGVTEAEFDSSLVYYYSHADRFKSIYMKVAERLNEDAKDLGASVGELGRYSQYSATGDTANVWQNETDVLLLPKPTANRYDIHVEADTSYHKGDSFMFQFHTEYIFQSGSRDAVLCLVAKYEGDSIIQNTVHVSTDGLTQARLTHYREGKLKELNGFIYLNNNQQDGEVRKLMFIEQIQLIRFHQKQTNNEPITKPAGDTTDPDKSIQADSSARTADTQRGGADSLRRGNQQRNSGAILPPQRGIPIHRVDIKADDAKRRR